MTIKPRLRFAPSPTGYLHLGNARMATLNCFLAKKINADYILRIDDTDLGRVKQEYIDAVKEDLTWLGVSWVEEFKQSERLDIYNNFLNKMKQENLAYPCYETQEELEYKKKLQIARKQPPIYDRCMLNLSEKEKKEYEASGRKPYYRLKITHEDIAWKDLIKGDILFKGEHISDPVVVREDGSFLYLLTSVIDDIERNITHIIRGEDHVVNTAIQIQMFKYLKATIPIFAHLPLITNNQGEGFSKRDGALSLRSLRSQGIHPMAINNYLFMLGLGEQNKIYHSNEEIAKDFALEKYNSASAKFDQQKLLKLNLQILQGLPFLEIKNLVHNYLQLDIEESFWNAIKHNINIFTEINQWYDIAYSDDLKTSLENKELITIALQTIPTENFDDNSWNVWLNKIKTQTTLSGKSLFLPLRLAFMGVENGPDFSSSIQLIGRDRLQKRLERLL